MHASVATEDRGLASNWRANDRAVRLWLIVIAALVFAMIVVGGATRLTGSGLSITEWKPILGVLPPLSTDAWNEAFAKYRETLQYKLVNKGLSLDGFQFIYWWEWAHRFFGRFIGVAFAVLLAWFWWRGALRPKLAPKLVGLLALGGLQGVVGWYMVQSGLVDRVDVSQYRLALHLTLAFAILAMLLWLVFDLGAPGPERDATSAQRWLARAVLAILFVQVASGALVAGLKAGLTYNTWPMMDGQIVPDGLLAIEPWHLNIFENVATVQFQHRMLAYAVLALTLVQLWLARTSPLLASALILALAVLVQAAVGILTLVSAAGQIPIGLGLAHQAGAAAVAGLAVWHAHRAIRPGG